MITSEVKGCLISNFENNKYDIIVHGCNCFNTMGAGLAKTIKSKFPSTYEADLKTIKGDKNKLGTFTFSCNNYGIIINAYTQYRYSSKYINCDYDAIKNVFIKINEQFKGKFIGIPAIGSGLAGGDWNKIYTIINENTPDINIEVVYYN